MLFLTEKKKENISEIPSLAFLADTRKKTSKSEKRLWQAQNGNPICLSPQTLEKRRFSFFCLYRKWTTFFSKREFPRRMFGQTAEITVAPSLLPLSSLLHTEKGFFFPFSRSQPNSDFVWVFLSVFFPFLLQKQLPKWGNHRALK